MSPMGLDILDFDFLIFFVQFSDPVSPSSGNRNKLSLPRYLLCFFSSFLDDSSSQRKVDQSTPLHLCAMNPSFMGSFRISPSDFLYISILLKIVYTITIEICDEFQPQFHCFRRFYLEAIKRNWQSFLRWADQTYQPIQCLLRRTDQTLSSSSMPSLFFGYLHLLIGSVSSEKHK